MSKCRRCNIDVLDHSLSCPLCNGVLEYDPVKDPESEKDFLDHSQETGEKSKSVCIRTSRLQCVVCDLLSN